MSKDLELILIQVILYTGWPILGVMTYFIIKRARQYYYKLRGEMVGRLIIPTVFGWLYGLFSLGIVSTSYMLSVEWHYVILPIFLSFLVAIVVIYKAIKKWEIEATELQAFYHDLEFLVKKRTKELEEAHRLQIGHEKEIQKLKDQFVFIAAHELRTPVTAIRWAIENALEGEGLTDDLRDQLNVVNESNLRLIKLVDDLLNTAKIESGTIKMEPAMVSLNKIIEYTLKELEPLFLERGIDVRRNFSEDKEVFVDKERLKQVLVNFLSNAVKYNQDNGYIEVSTSYDKNFAKISVKDSGYGISEEDIKKLFNKFSRIDNAHTKNVEGTGLGLYLTKEIIKKSGGEIYVESVINEGSTFSFTVPLNS